jgi:hypothetical protein
MSPAALYKGYLQKTATNGIYSATGGGGTDTRTISPACGANAITANTCSISRDGMEITNAAAFGSYVHQDGDMLWIHAESATGLVVLSQSGAGAYRIMGKVGANTIAIDRSCRRESITTGSIDATLYPRTFSTGAPVKFSKVPGKPYKDPHDPQQYASMQSIIAQNQETALVNFVPFEQYDGDYIAAFKDYRHSSAMYDFAANAVKGRPTALSSTLVGAQVG